MDWLNQWLLPKIETFYRPQWTKGGITRELILTNFECKNVSKSYNGSFIWFLCCLKKAFIFFFQFCTDLSMKSKSVKTITYAFESCHYSLENSLVYKGLSHSSWDINDENIKKMLTQQKVNKIFQFQTLISQKKVIA